MNDIKENLENTVYFNEAGQYIYLVDFYGNFLFSNMKIIDDNEPVKTGRMINDKEEYVIRLNLGLMPNATSKNITLPVSLENVLLTRKVNIFLLSSTEYAQNDSSLTYFINKNQLNVKTTNDKSRFTGYTELYFTYK